jgi:2,3-bisphosphoglycerate-independent phosphoglycerate mutase
MGAGLDMAPGDIAFKSNFATLDPASGLVTKRRADRHFEHLGPPLCAALDGLALPSFPQHAISVGYATEHRCGVVVRGPGLSDAIEGTDPLKDGRPLLASAPLDDSLEARRRRGRRRAARPCGRCNRWCLPRPLTPLLSPPKRPPRAPQAAHTAAIVNELSAEIQKVLAGHPLNAQRVAEGLNAANVVLLRGCGCRIAVPTFQELHGMRAALVAPTKIIAGLGMSFGIDRRVSSSFFLFVPLFFAATHTPARCRHHSRPPALARPLTLTPPPHLASYKTTHPNARAQVRGAGRHGVLRLGLCVQGRDGGGVPDVPRLRLLLCPREGGGRRRPRPLRDAQGTRCERALAGRGAARCRRPKLCAQLTLPTDALLPNPPNPHHQMQSHVQPRFLESVDVMVRQLVARLWADEAAGGGPYALAVTGDHSTPVAFGDHSHEPVPFAVAHLEHVVAALGGGERVLGTDLGRVPLPDVKAPPPAADLAAQAAQQAARRRACHAGVAFEGAVGPELGPWAEPWPQATAGDGVRFFDETSAARGALGRFPGSQAMTIIKQACGVE